jgi:hypothetical protein
MWRQVIHLTQAALIAVGSMGSASATTLAGAFNAEMRTWMGAHGIARSSLAVMRDGRLVHLPVLAIEVPASVSECGACQRRSRRPALRHLPAIICCR